MLRPERSGTGDADSPTDTTHKARRVVVNVVNRLTSLSAVPRPRDRLAETCAEPLPCRRCGAGNGYRCRYAGQHAGIATGAPVALAVLVHPCPSMSQAMRVDRSANRGWPLLW